MKQTSLLIALLVLAACKPEQGARTDFRHTRGEGTAVATFGDDRITAEELQAQFARMPPYQRSRYEALEARKELVDGLGRFELLAREAARRGLHNDPEVVAATKRVMVHKLLRDELEGFGSKISDADIEAWYAAHITDFQKPEMVQVNHVFLALAEGADPAAVRTRAEALLEEAKALEPRDVAGFATLAAARSEDAQSKPLGGDLRVKSRAELAQAWGEPVAEAAFSLSEPGALSGVVQGTRGFHVLKLQRKTPAVSLALTQPQTRTRVIQSIRKEREIARYEALLAKLRETDGYRVDEAALTKVVIDLKAPLAPPKGPPPGYIAAPSDAVEPPPGLGEDAQIPPFPLPR